MVEPRITVSISAEGELEVFLNEAGREKLVQELQKLNRRHDHFHLMVDECAEVQLKSRPYRANDKVIEYGKVLLRPDEWDKEHYPHLFD